MQKYIINGKTLTFKTHEFEGTKSIEYYENQIIKTLNKIGVNVQFIEINYSNNDEVPFAEVIWQINEKDFVFKCESQKTTTKNLGAIAQAIQEDVRQVTRGIKDLFTIMNQYKSINKISKKKNLFDYKTDGYEKDFDVKELQSQKEVSGDLNKDYAYLTKYPTEKLEMFYIKFKEECIKKQNLNHPLLIALKIIRQNRGLKL